MDDDGLVKYQLLGDHALVISYEPDERKQYPDFVGMHFNHLRKNLTRGIRDIVLCYSSIGVYFDNRVITHSEVEAEISTVLGELSNYVGLKGEEVIIPVFYGRKFGPDLEKAAQYLNMTAEELIQEHSSHKYTVSGIGFLPGFPYMGPLPQQLVIPRKPVPAPAVPAGSVAIAGQQTGIYPFDSPGGWHVIGWTPVKMFDITRPAPSYLKPGDTVTFVPSFE